MCLKRTIKMVEWNCVDNNMFRAESERFEESEKQEKTEAIFPVLVDSNSAKYDS